MLDGSGFHCCSGDFEQPIIGFNLREHSQGELLLLFAGAGAAARALADLRTSIVQGPFKDNFAPCQQSAELLDPNPCHPSAYHPPLRASFGFTSPSSHDLGVPYPVSRDPFWRFPL